MADKIEIEVEVKDQTARQKIKEFNKEISALDKQIKKLGTNRVDEFFGDLSAQLSASENKLPQLKGALSGVNTQLAEMIKQYPDMKTMAAVAEKSAAFPEHIQSRLKGYGIPQEALDSYNQLLQKQAELKSAIGGTQNEIKNYKSMLADAGSTTTGSDDFDKQKAALEQLVQEQREYLQGMSDMSQVSNEYIVNAVAGISRLKTEMEDLKTVGKTFGTNIYDEDFQNLHALEQELKHYKAELIKEAPLPKYLQEYVDKSTVANNKISKLSTELKELKQQQKEMEQAGLGLGTKEYDETLVKIKNIENELKAYKKSLLDAQEVKPKTSLWEKFKSVLKSIGGVARSVAKRMTGAFLLPFKSINKNLDGFNKRLKTAILQGLIFRQVRSILQKTVQSAYELAITNKQVSDSFAQVKGAAITGFQPILTALVPVIQTVCNWLVILIQYITALLNLFGFIGKNSKSAAKAMSQQAGATGSAAKANDKFLASWDTVQQVQQKSSGGGGGSDITPDFDFDDAGVEEKLDWLKKKIALDDWYGIGMEIAKRLNEINTSIADWLKDFSPKVLEWSKDFTDLMNGLTDGWDPKPAAEILSTSLNTVVGAIDIFFANYHWAELGKKLGLFINYAFELIDWALIGKTLSDGIKGLFTSLYTFLETVDWQQIGTAVQTFLLNIDWIGLLGVVGRTIVDVVIAAIDFTSGLTGIDFSGITQLFKDLRDSVSDLFSVVSGDTSFSDWFGGLSDGETILLIIAGAITGVAVAIGIYNGVVAIASAVTTAFGTVLFFLSMNPIVLIIAAIVAIIAIIVLCIKHWDQIKEAVSKVVDSIKGKIDEFKAKVDEKFAPIKKWISDLIDKWNNFKQAVSDAVSKAKEAIANKLGEIVTKFSNWFNNDIKPWFSLDKWLGLGSDCIQGLINGLNSAWSKITDWAKGVIDHVKEGLGIHSPSKEFAEIGVYSVKGFLKGLEDNEDFLVKFFSNLLLIVFNNVKDVLVKKVNDLLDQSSENIDSFLSITTKKVTETSKNIILQIYAVINALNAIPRYILTVHEIRTMQTDGGSLNSVAKVAATRVSAGVASLPHFAQGAVVNPGRQFEAILGDNRVEQEVVSPLSTMKEAFIEALQQSGYNRGGKIVMEMDGKVFAKVANPYFEKENSRIGIKAVGGI